MQFTLGVLSLVRAFTTIFFTFIFPVLAAAAAAFALTGCPGGMPQMGLEETKDVVYGTGYVEDPANPGQYITKDLLLDVYSTASPGDKQPAVLLIHGGSFEEGSKENEEVIEYARYFARRGYVCFAMNYRLQADKPPAPMLWDIVNLTSTAHAAFVDTKAAIRFVRANADKYNVDPDRIGVWGESAGAICALTAAVTDPDDYASDGGDFPIPEGNNPGVSPRVQACIDLWGGADHVLLQFDRGDPPIMVLHGEDDDRAFTWFSAAERIHFALELYDIPHEFYPIEGAGHGAWDAIVNFKNVKTLCVMFLNEHL